MSGRLLGGAIATITGVAIGVSTFGPELKKARQKRLQEEYDREVAALKNDVSPATPGTSVVKSTEPEPLPNNKSDEKSSRLSSLLGLWAWKSNTSDAVPNKEPQTSKETRNSS